MRDVWGNEMGLWKARLSFWSVVLLVVIFALVIWVVWE